MYRAKLLASVLAFTLVFMIVAPVSAHELWIEVEEVEHELKVDVMWGHIGDYLDTASHEDYQLWVRYPGGEEEILELEGIGVQARTFLAAPEEGEYLFWAEREPGTYTPDDGVTTLSVQMAKSVYQLGEGPGNSGEPAGMPLEIVPETELENFTTGTFHGKILLEGEPFEQAAISAYGPENRVLEGESNPDGTFELELDIPGTWLIKGNVTAEEEGNLDGDDYEMVSRTTTFLVDTSGKAGEEIPGAADPGDDSTPTVTMVISLLIGALVGGASTLLLTRKK